MGHSHHHGRRRPAGAVTPRRLFEPHDDLTDERTERSLWIAVALAGLVTLIGLAGLWPSGEVTTALQGANLFGDRIEAIVTATEVTPCSFDPVAGCQQVTLQILSGPNTGTNTAWEQPYPGPRTLEQDDEIFVYESVAEDGTVLYSFADYQRGTPLILLAVIFVVAVLLLARWKGLGAIGGLCASLLVLTAFMLPSLLRGHNAIGVALVGSSTIAFIALYLAHGVNISTTVALLSTFASLCIIGILSWIFVEAASFTGFTEDSSFALNALGVQIDPRGLLLAGIVIGSLGVLDDVTVTQVSAVWELRQLQPAASRQEIYTAAVNIGRDHISSTVNTLFLTYAGAALPLLLLFAVAGQSITSVATSEVVATEIVRALVGSIGLVASVPISTWLAARVLTVREDHRLIK